MKKGYLHYIITITITPALQGRSNYVASIKFLMVSYFNFDFSNMYTFSTTSTSGHHFKLFKYPS